MWFGFLFYLIVALLVISTLWQFCGAKSRKYPVLLLIAGFLVAVTGVFLIWASDNWSFLIKHLCDKNFNQIKHECGLDATLGGLTVKLIELGFAALGAGLMGLAFDIKTKDDLDTVRKAAREKLARVKQKTELWQQKREKLGQELDSLTPAEKVNRHKILIDEGAKLIDKLYDAEEAFEKWL